MGYGQERSKSVFHYKKNKLIKPPVRVLPEFNFKDRLTSVIKKRSEENTPIKQI